MKIIKLSILCLISIISISINYSWAESAEEFYLESKDLFQESRFDIDKLKLALKKIDKAISLAPNNVKLLAFRGSIYLMNKEYDKAIINYKDALSIDPEDANIYSQIGDLNFYQNKYDEALGYYGEALLLDEKNWRTYQNRGYVFYLQNKNTRALDDFNEAIKLNPQALFAYNNRGVLHFDIGDSEKALADFKKVEEIDPRSPVPSFYQGRYLEIKGEIHAAAKKYKAAIDIAKNLPQYPKYPEAEVALERVSSILAKQGS